jgi:hypothetical protein
MIRLRTENEGKTKFVEFACSLEELLDLVRSLGRLASRAMFADLPSLLLPKVTKLKGAVKQLERLTPE